MTDCSFPPPDTGNTVPSQSLSALPPEFGAQLETLLAADETILAWLETDLDTRLHFAPGLVLLTNHRLLARSGDDDNWQSYPLRSGLTLVRNDH